MRLGEYEYGNGWFYSANNLFIILILISIGSYSFILFVKLAHRGIKALDIYINEKNNKL